MKQTHDDVEHLLKPYIHTDSNNNIVCFKKIDPDVKFPPVPVDFLLPLDGKKLGKKVPPPPVAIGILGGLMVGSLIYLGLFFSSRHPSCSLPLPIVLPARVMPRPCAAGRKADRFNNKNFLFIGVMTAKMFLDSRANALYHAWGKEAPGKLTFFSSFDDSINVDVPIITIPGVDDTYPPQKKSFLMIKYIYDNCLDNFEWFIRADDDVFYRLDELEKFLRSINSSKPWYIGQPGQGNSDEFGQLSFAEDENFCMGGPGMIMSRGTIERIGPYIQDCLHNNLFSSHEDVEIGRCVRKHAGIPCTWNFDMLKIMFHNGTSKISFTGNLDTYRIEKSMAFHPIKKPAYQFRLANHMRSLKIAQLKNKIIQLKRSIFEYSLWLGKSQGVMGEEIHREFGNGSFTLRVLPPSLTDWNPRGRGEIWEFIDRWSRSSEKWENPRKGHGPVLKNAFGKVKDHLVAIANVNSHLRGRFIDFKELSYGYMRRHPLKGVEYSLDLVFIYRKHDVTTRTFNVRWNGRVRQPFSEIEFREEALPKSKIADRATRYELSKRAAEAAEEERNRSVFASIIIENLGLAPKPPPIVSLEPVNFILTLAGRLENFKRFMNFWEESCFGSFLQSCTIVVVTFPTGDPAEDYAEEKEAFFASMRRRHPGTLMRLERAQGHFVRGIGLEIGAAFYAPDALLFLCDVDLVFTSGLVDRVRRNTIQGRRVYYPIMYSQYDRLYTALIDEAAVDSSDNYGSQIFFSDRTGKAHSPPIPFTPGWNETSNCINDEHLGDIRGYWRQFSFGMVALYNSDLRRVGGFDLSIKGWGKEDTDLFTKVVDAGLDILRAVDLGLVHVYHSIHCDRTLPDEQLVQCLNTQMSTFLARTILAKMVLPSKDSFAFRKDAALDDIVPL